MMKRMKKLAAIALAATMALSSTVSLAATPTTWSALSAETASGESIGNGQLEAYLDKDVFDVVLPTNNSVENTFDFYADPQGLLNATQPTVYTGTAGSIYFNNKTVTSDAITVKNKSSIDVNIAMDVAVTTTGVAITTKGSIKDVKTPAVALVMTASSAGVATSNAIKAKNTSTADNGDGAVNIKEQLVSAASVYAVTVSNSSVGRNAVASTVSPGYFYSYDIKPNTPESSFKTIDFTLSGECNKVDGWKDIKANAIKTAVTWKITTDEVEPTVAYGLYNSTQNSFFLALTNAPSWQSWPESATISTVTINGKSCPASFDTTTYSGNKYLKIAGTDVKNVFGNFPETYEITFTIDGIDYIAHPTIS